MFLKMIGLRETLLADLARERTFAGVRAHVLCEVAAVAELVTAHRTRVALLAGVRDHMTLQRRRVDERLGADRADVRTLARVRAHVFLQQVRSGVLVAADFARERTLTCNITIPPSHHTAEMCTLPLLYSHICIHITLTSHPILKTF